MNRRTLVLGIAALAVGMFGIGAWIVQQNPSEPLAAPAVDEGTPLVRPLSLIHI